MTASSFQSRYTTSLAKTEYCSQHRIFPSIKISTTLPQASETMFRPLFLPDLLGQPTAELPLFRPSIYASIAHDLVGRFGIGLTL